MPEHLARHRLADLFLDTFPVNAHTTASDALWAGCPVITLAGNTFISRVAGSVLRTIGLPELVTTSLNEYQHLAACDSRIENRTDWHNCRPAWKPTATTSPLLFRCGIVRSGDLERAFTTMQEIHEAEVNGRVRFRSRAKSPGLTVTASQSRMNLKIRLRGARIRTNRGPDVSVNSGHFRSILDSAFPRDSMSDCLSRP